MVHLKILKVKQKEEIFKENNLFFENTEKRTFIVRNA